MLTQRATVHPRGQATTALVRVSGRWDLTCQTVNLIVGSAIFVLPGVTLVEMGVWAPLAVLAAVPGVLCVALTFVEAAGRYRDPGGLYRYAGDAFGEYVGTQIGLLYWVVRATASAAVANIFVSYFAEVWPAAEQPAWRAVLLTVVILGAGWINIRGARGVSSVINIMTLAKLLPLVLLCVVGVFAISPGSLTGSPFPSSSSWVRGILLWVFAFGAFEAALIPAGEARDPVRDGPRALLQALGIVAFIYLTIQVVVVGTLTGEVSQRPVSQAAGIWLGSAGALLVALGAMIATSGHIVGSVFASSRITFAIAERGGLPRVLVHVHPVFRTPDVSILLFTALVWIFAISGSFVWNATLSAVARLIVYAVTSVAVLRLRRLGRSAFQVPAWVHVAAAGFCAWLFANQTPGEAAAVGVVVIAGSGVWLAYRLWRRWLAKAPDAG